MSEPAPRIRILPPELADQIAAGEVVERAASVVKELCENALDAGARRIDVEVEGAGQKLIRVVDDGQGMTDKEAHLALLRHATSKLQSAADLISLATMGFRGEALPSIAAVSRFVLTTRARGALSGWRIVVEGGIEKEARDCGAPEGTAIEVRDLLFNVPARLKFLKAEPTEMAHISEAVSRLALAFPQVHFRLKQGTRIVIDLPAHSRPIERAQAVLGRALFAVSGQEKGVEVDAFLASPAESQATARGVYLFVDRRFIRDRNLAYALTLGYGELLERGRHPVAAVLLRPPAGSVDVNVHPQKIEVRFARPQEVHAAIRHAVASAMARAPWLAARPSGKDVYVPLAWARASGTSLARENQQISFEGDAHPIRASAVGAGPTATPAPSGDVSAAEPADAFFSTLAYIGQLARTYLVCEAHGELVLIDQHAGHERIAYERLQKAHAQRQMQQQRLLFPLTLAATPAELAAAHEHGELLLALGFELEPFGTDTIAVKAVPQILGDADPAPALRDMLGQLCARGSTEAIACRTDHLLATVACHSVVRAGDVLDSERARALLAGLDETPNRGHCPHGRPVALRVPLSELERRFGRT